MVSGSSGHQSHVDAAFAAGATVDEIVGVIIAIGPTVGLARFALAASPLGLTAGSDIDVDLENLDPE